MGKEEKWCLFLGNGVNRAFSNITSWQKLLINAANASNVKYLKSDFNTLSFEKMVNDALKKRNSAGYGIYSQIKANIAEDLKGYDVKNTCFFDILKSSNNISSIITTNFDIVLEEQLGLKNKNEIKTGKSIICKKPIWTSPNGIEVYHAHGIVKRPSTICLGYEHYAALVEKIRSEINGNDNPKLIADILNGNKERTGTWYEKFYTDNIVFVGFGLEFSEIDIWEILALRASLYYSDYNELKTKKLLKNRIVYYDITEGNKKSEKHKLLESFNVEVKRKHIKNKNEYGAAYQKIISEIKNGI